MVNPFDSYEERQLDLVRFCAEVSVSPYISVDQFRNNVVRVVAQFYEGSEFITSQKECEQVQTYTTLKHWTDHIKLSLVTWQPSLDFGWLSPEYTAHEIKFNYVHTTNKKVVVPYNGYNEYLRMAKFNEDITRFR